MKPNIFYKTLIISIFFICVSVVGKAIDQNYMLSLNLMRMQEKYDVALKEANASYEIAKERKDWLGAARTLMIMMNIYTNTDDHINILKCSKESFTVGDNTDSHLVKAYVYYTQSLYQEKFNNSKKSVEYCLMALEEMKSHKDDFLMCKIYNSLFNNSISEIKNIDLSYKYAKECLRYALLTKDYDLLGLAYFNMGAVYTDKFKLSKKNHDKNKIFYCYSKVKEIYYQHPDKVSFDNYGLSCVNLANYFWSFFPEADENAKKKALENIEEALVASSGIDNFNKSVIIANSYGLLYEYAIRDNNLDKAEKLLTKSYDILNGELKSNPNLHSLIYSLSNISETMVKFSERQGNYKKALEFQKKYTEYVQMLDEQNKEKNIEKLEAQFKFSRLEEKESKQRWMNNLYSGAVLILICFLVMLFFIYRQKLRYTKERALQLESEKQNVLLQVKFEREEQARLVAEQNLMEIRQKQLRKETLASTLQLQHKKELLQNIKKNVDNIRSNDMLKIIREENSLDSGFEEVKSIIKDVHPDFYNVLNKKSNNGLTSLDLKYCAYIHLKMDTKTIANLFHVEPKSVQIAKYRIKKKLQLGRDKDLVHFLQNL